MKIYVPIDPYKQFEEDSKKSFPSDLFRRESFASLISEHILNTNPDHSFAIGIIGKWGSGKSYFLSQIDKNIADKCIVVNFNPWKSKSSKQILEDFFLTLTDELKKYDPDLSGQFQTYAQALLSMEDTLISKIGKPLKSLFFKDSSIQNQYETLKESINKKKHKVVIFVDDIDRLDSIEIIEILRIIRNTINFPNTFFVVAYDLEYLLASIKKSTIPRFENYLEKIFQLEITLPAYNYSILFKKQIEFLIKNRAINEQQLIENALKELDAISSEVMAGFIIRSNSFFKEYIKTLRDVIRFSNAFNINYYSKEEEVDLVDFLLLEMLKLKFHRLYISIVEQLTTNFHTTFLVFETSNNGETKIKFNESQFKIFFSELEIKPEYKELLSATLEYLFNRDQKMFLQRSISNPQNSLVYFSADLFERIPFKAFNKARRGYFNDFKLAIDAWITEDKYQELSNIFLKTIIFENKIDFENMIRALIYLSRKVDRGLASDLFSKLNKVGLNVERYYNGNKDLYKAFLIHLFDEAEFPYTIEAMLAYDFLYLILRTNVNYINSLFSKVELQDIIYNLFERRITTPNAAFDDSIWAIYYSNVEDINSENERIELTQKANALFKSYVKEHSTEYVKSLIRSSRTPSNNDYHTLEPFFIQTFGSMEEFVGFLNSIPVTMDVLEVKTLLRKYIQNGNYEVNFKRGTIEFISDVDSVFMGSDKYPHLENGTSVVTFLHEETARITKLKRNFAYANWIAHIKPEYLDNDQATNGGDYTICFDFNLPISVSKIKSAKIALAVDDKCSVILNGEIIRNEIITYKEPLVEINLTNKLKERENSICFKIVNFSAQEIGFSAGTILRGTENPYGIIFIIEIQTEFNNV